MKHIVLVFLVFVYSYSCSQLTQEEKAEQIALNEIQSQYVCDSIMFSTLDSVTTTLFDDHIYDNLWNQKQSLENQINKEVATKNKYENDFSSKGKYLSSTSSSSIKKLKEEIYDIEEEMDKLRETFAPRFKGYSLLARYQINNTWQCAKFEFDSQLELIDYTLDCLEIFENPIIAYHTKDANLNDKFGLKYKRVGGVLTPPIYDTIYESGFTGLYTVKANNKYGHVLEWGKILTPLQYDSIFPIKGSVAMVNLNGKYGFINLYGKEIVPIKFDGGEYFEGSDYLLVRQGGKKGQQHDGAWGVYDNSGKEILAVVYDYFDNRLCQYKRYF